MNARLFVIAVLLLSSIPCLSVEVCARLFARSPKPGPGELETPRVLAVQSATATCYVLDSRLERVVAITLDGQELKNWSLTALGVEGPLAPDPLLPNPALAVASETVYLLNLNRDERTVELVTLEGPGDPRLVTLPDGATHGAVAVDSAGRVLAAYLQPTDAGIKLVLAREGANGKMSALDSLLDPCDGQTKDLALTGFVVMPDGKMAIGLAQAGDPRFSFVRSWLVQGTVRGGAVNRPMTVTHRFALLTPQKTVRERFMASVALAGKYGYPAKPCVPLGTSLLVSPDGMVISGGHSLDPFLRIYGKEETLARSVPRRAQGGQHLALYTGKGGVRLLATAPAAHRIVELAPDGRERGGFGSQPAYSLARPVSIAANQQLVFVVTGERGAYRLACFSRERRFLWEQPLPAPAKLPQAQPLLAAIGDERVFVGWKLPTASGVGWVESILNDGTQGVPLWQEPFTTATQVDSGPCATPLLAGPDGRLYVLRQVTGGVRLQAYSANGAYLLGYPAGVRSQPFTSSTVGATWLRAFGDQLWFVTTGADGKEQKWKRLPREGRNARLHPVYADGLWGWLTSTQSLLRFDDKLTLVDEITLMDDEGAKIDHPLAVAGDGSGTIYFALPGKILEYQP